MVMCLFAVCVVPRPHGAWCPIGQTVTRAFCASFTSLRDGREVFHDRCHAKLRWLCCNVSPRLKIYEDSTKPLIEYFSGHGVYLCVLVRVSLRVGLFFPLLSLSCRPRDCPDGPTPQACCKPSR